MKIEKAKEISDAKISFVSLVDKAANKKQFLITKAESGQAGFSTYGKIVKVDSENHYVTGIVYEPMTEDSHENYMTETEIQKAAYWYAKNGDQVDLQHSFERLDGACVVENFAAKSDMEIEGEEIKKGTWLMTVEIADSDVWEQIEKGEITGFSMGGVGKYSTEDVDIDAIEKGKNPTEKVGIIQKIAGKLGYDLVKKGAVTDYYARESKRSNFWTAFSALRETLHTEHYDYSVGRYVDDFEPDEEKVKEALTEFNQIIVELLKTDGIAKSLAGSAPAVIAKAGKKMSGSNKEKLNTLYAAFENFKKEFDDEEEEEEVKKSEVERIVQDAVTKAMEPVTKALSGDGEPVKKDDAGQDAEEVTPEAIEKMVSDTVAAAIEPLSAQLEDIKKSRSLPSNLNDAGSGSVEKAETHYMAGMF